MQEMKYFNEGNDCDICKNQLMTGRDGTVEDCRRRQNGLSCRFEERDIRTCPVCEHEVDREEMHFTKFDYYMAAYDDDLILIAAKGKKDIRITGAAAGASFEDIQSQLIDEKASSGWKEQIADAVDRVVDKMLQETPPETEEERQNCETMRETIKGMFLTQRRSKTEAAFITENIDRYEELFEICMNGDDAQFKKGITELQKAQNEYILQKERENG